MHYVVSLEYGDRQISSTSFTPSASEIPLPQLESEQKEFHIHKMVAKEKMENDKKKMETNWLCVQKWKTRKYCHHKWKCGGVHDSREFGGDEMAAELQQQRLSNELDESGMLTYRQGTPCETFSLLKHLSIEINSEEISIFLQKCRKFKFHFTLRNEVLNNLPVNCFHSDRLYTLHQPCHPFHFPRLSFN